jgi:hypothetical protein
MSPKQYKIALRIDDQKIEIGPFTHLSQCTSVMEGPIYDIADIVSLGNEYNIEATVIQSDMIITKTKVRRIKNGSPNSDGRPDSRQLPLWNDGWTSIQEGE